MDVGLIGGSFKPTTAGHIGLFKLAARETDRVILYVSLKDRARPGEMPVRGEDMAKIWEEHIRPILPENLALEYVDVPVAAMYELLGEADQDPSDQDTYVIYSDPDDLATRFSERTLQKYCPRLFEEGRVRGRPVQRTETVNVSGTKMRAAIVNDDFETFKAGMPKGIDTAAVWDLLRGQVGNITPMKKPRKGRKLESLLRTYVRTVVERH